MIYSEKIREKIWSFITPIFPFLRDGLVRLGVLRHPGRQKYQLGWLAMGKTLSGLAEHLKQYGFANHFIAWVDSDEVLGLRKRENFKYQYHLRVFNDGEIRGHYELTPESHPLDHFWDVGTEPRFEDFYAWLGDWVTRVKPKAAPTTLRPLSESIGS